MTRLLARSGLLPLADRRAGQGPGAARGSVAERSRRWCGAGRGRRGPGRPGRGGPPSAWSGRPARGLAGEIRVSGWRPRRPDCSAPPTHRRRADAPRWRRRGRLREGRDLLVEDGRRRSSSGGSRPGSPARGPRWALPGRLRTALQRPRSAFECGALSGAGEGAAAGGLFAGVALCAPSATGASPLARPPQPDPLLFGGFSSAP